MAIKVFVVSLGKSPCRGIYSGENGDARQRQKFDIQKVSRESKFDFQAVCDHRSAVFFLFSFPFFSSRISPFRSLSLFLSPFSRGAARPEVAQTRQGSYSLEERVLRVTAGCSLFLDYSTATPGWRTPAESKTESRREREREREWKNEKKREKKRQRQIVVERVRGTRSKSFPVETSKTVLTTQQNTGRFVRLSLNVLHSKDSP